jgi:pimeloyl-ACP methyl ester carboxylesterase
MSTYILVHGAWHGAWYWEKVAPLLRQAGHQVIPFDLPGHGQDKTPVADQRQMYTAWPCQKVFALETSHSPFFSAPELLSRLLLSA